MEGLAKPWGELALYFDYGLKQTQGQVPYVHFFPEYPILALWLFKLPLMLGFTERTYMIGWYLLVAIAIAICAIAIKLMGGKVWAFVAGILPLGGLFWDRFDIFPAMMSLLAFLFIGMDLFALSFLAISIGFLMKIYPIIFLPYLLFWAKVRKAPIKKCLLVFMLPIVISTGMIIYGGGGAGLLKFVTFQGKRGIHLESIKATPLLIQHLQGKVDLETTYAHNTYEVIKK